MLAASVAAAVRHELEVVDNDECEVWFSALQRLCPGAELEQAERRGLVDVGRRGPEPGAGLGEARPVVLGELAGADVVGVVLAARADQPLRDLLPRHLEGEECAWHLLVDSDVAGDLEREATLSHRGTGGDAHEVRGLEAGGDPIQVLEAAREPGHLGAGLVEVADPLERLDERVLEEDELALRTALAEVVDELFGARDELRRLAFALPAEVRDLATGADQAAQSRRLADDLRVVAGVGGRGDPPGGPPPSGAAPAPVAPSPPRPR